MKYYYTVLFAITVFCSVFAGTTGKISGSVSSGDSNEPLPGVNISVVGTSIGTITSGRGDYIILNLPPGIYTLRFSYIGYETVIVEENIVRSDQTTPIEPHIGREDYHLTEDLADQAIKWMRKQMDSIK